jgi:hypothetical protein
MDLMTLLAVLGPFVASVILMNTEDGQAQAVADQFGTDLRSVVDHMIKDGINLFEGWIARQLMPQQIDTLSPF